MRAIGRVRILVAILVHVLLAAHLWAWYGLGWRGVGTVSAASLFYLLQVGLINAGVVLVGASLIGCLVLGNAFCGWACHFGALQDLTAWGLRKVGLRPLALDAPRRLRAVLLVKVLAINTLITWTTLGALPRPLLRPDTPEPLFAVGTPVTVLLDVGVLALGLTYVFGHRAFCRILCPVILIARLGNLVAPGRLRRRRPCLDCGACDRACPMGNPVAAMIRLQGSVAALDCIRCGRCRDACPAGAIGYAFELPTASRPASPRRLRVAGGLALVAGGLLGLVGYEILAGLRAAGLLASPLASHLPNWELFYAALGMLLAAAGARAIRTKGASLP